MGINQNLKFNVFYKFRSRFKVEVFFVQTNTNVT